MKRILILSWVVFSFISVRAQQDPMFTQYMFNMQSVNPGYAGSRESLVATLISRWQWIGIEGSPSTQTFTAQALIPETRLGVGLSFTQDKVGPLRQSLPYVDLAYHLPVDNKSKLSFGMKLGATFIRSDLNALLASEGDPEAGNLANGLTTPNLGFGAYYYRPRFYFGLSAPKMFQASLDDINTGNNTFQARHFFGIIGAVFRVSPVVEFKPTLLTKAVEGTPVQSDISANFLLYEQLWLGATYRTRDGLAAMIQYEFDNGLHMGYAYDYPLTGIKEGINGVLQATHELMVRYEWKFKRILYKTPRYF
ncbi:MAG: type IX secretion system membrane protein PorP/SprF [Cyclobacteriaceae bacterium]